MIRGLVDFALNNRFMVLAIAILLFVWGAISFHNLPVEAYPDVANNYVRRHYPVARPRRRRGGAAGHGAALKSRWPGIPHMQHLRSFSLAGLSSVKLIFDDDSINDWNREKVLGTAFAGHAARGSAAADRAPTGVRSGRSTGTPCIAPIPPTTTWS